MKRNAYSKPALTLAKLTQATVKVLLCGAKGGKGRTVYLGKVARRALWRYLADREDGEASVKVPCFTGRGLY